MTTNTLTVDQLIASQETLLNSLKAQEDKLNQIQKAQYPLIVKWQMMLGVLLPIQIEQLKKMGFSDEQKALLEYNQQLMQTQQSESKLQALVDQRWDYIFDKAFGIQTAQKLSLDKARSLITDITTAMTAEPFLQQVDAMMAQLPPSTPLMNKRQALLGVLLPLHMSVMAKHGFEGEQGYVQAQKALMDHLHDKDIMQKSLVAQEVLFKRAGVMG